MQNTQIQTQLLLIQAQPANLLKKQCSRVAQFQIKHEYFSQYVLIKESTFFLIKVYLGTSLADSETRFQVLHCVWCSTWKMICMQAFITICICIFPSRLECSGLLTILVQLHWLFWYLLLVACYICEEIIQSSSITKLAGPWQLWYADFPLLICFLLISYLSYPVFIIQRIN